MSKTEPLAFSVFHEMCLSTQSTYSMAASKALKEKGLAGLPAMPDPLEYDSASSFQCDYLVYSYLRKYRQAADEEALHAKAIDSFLETERKNGVTNARIRSGFLARDAEGILQDAKRKIERILGEWSWSAFLKHCEWGPGGTATIRRAVATVDRKLKERHLSVSRRCVKYAIAYLSHDIHWMQARLPHVAGPTTPLPGEFKVLDHSVFDTVVKDFESRRTIDKQPTLNTFFQKGVGGSIRQRLRRFGVDLDDQSRNQRLAALAYEQQLATEDLRNASNTVTLELVRYLLSGCPEWLQVMEDTRVTHCCIERNGVKELHKLELYSAMGNGFTFELESLIFLALSLAVQDEQGVPGPVAVYGDDIIVPAQVSERLRAVLSEVGFEINVRKSFNSGPFYESCGKHYFRGIEVTPSYQKEEVVDLPSAVRAFNRLYRWSERSCSLDFGLPMLRAAIPYAQANWYDHLRRQVRKYYQPTWATGDAAFVAPATLFRPDIHGTTRFHGLVPVGKRRPGDERALLATALRRADGRVPSGSGSTRLSFFDHFNEVQFQATSGFGGKVSPRDEYVYNLNQLKCWERGDDGRNEILLHCLMF